MLSEAKHSIPSDKTPMKLSVMIITYNHERFIAQAIESVLVQRVNFDYEIVVGEDCSTDGTRKILMDFHRRYPDRILPLLQNPNIGAMANSIATLSACRGKYLALLEGDDYWTHQDKLQTQVNFLDTHPESAMCCHRVQLLDKTGTAGLGVDVFPTIPCGSYAIDDLLRSNFIMTCSAVLRRDVIGTLPAWYSQMGLGDWPLFVLVASHGKIELMDESMAAYRVHPGSVWSSRPLIHRLRETSRMLRALDKHFAFQYTNTIRQTLSQSDLDSALIERENGNRANVGKHLLACIGHGGWRRFPPRLLAGLAAYTLIGPRYKEFSRASPVKTGSQGDKI
jgi:glycosyltransferase involved in cell wall biosynthesis